MAKTCPICGKKMGLMMKTRTVDGEICSLCASISSSYATKTINEIQNYWATNKERQKLFAPTQKLKSFMSGVITIDFTHQLFVFGDITKMKISPIFYAFDEVDGYGYEIVGQKTVTKKKGGVTRAIVGGALAGPVGAVVGSGTAKEETKTTGGQKILIVSLISYGGKKQVMCSNPPDGFSSFLDNCMAAKRTVNEQPATPLISSADEIMKYKSLLDQGVITQEEFEQKKKQLLGL